MTMHPAFVQALKPFAPPANDPAPNFLRLPFEIDTESGTVTADPRDVAAVFERVIDDNMELICERLLVLTRKRLAESADENLIARHAA
ncbi:hypothetical protein [Luteibacter sp. E-22]|uniref:hypothetical protein n=1 Tax=Luteibacter sp. E-22 TaxID=3404050 RepID=UPI003CF8A411